LIAARYLFFIPKLKKYGFCKSCLFMAPAFTSPDDWMVHLEIAQIASLYPTVIFGRI
jgi:hypothetical protein